MDDDQISINLTFNRGDPIYDILAKMRGDSLALCRYTLAMCNYASMVHMERVAGANAVASAAPSPAVQIAGFQAQLKVTSEATSTSIAPSVGDGAGPHLGQNGLAPEGQST